MIACGYLGRSSIVSARQLWLVRLERGLARGGACLGGTASVAVGVHFQDDGVVDEAVDGGDRHGGIGEDVVPGAERLVGGDQQGAALVASTDQLEEHACLGLTLLDIGEIVRTSRWYLSSFSMVAASLSSCRDICSCWTRSVVRVNSTR